jgi:Ankyrin repeat
MVVLTVTIYLRFTIIFIFFCLSFAHAMQNFDASSTQQDENFPLFFKAVQEGDTTAVQHLVTLSLDPVLRFILHCEDSWLKVCNIAKLSSIFVNTIHLKTYIPVLADHLNKQTTSDNITPLMVVALLGQEHLVALLLDLGANPCLRTQQGKNVIELLLGLGNNATQAHYNVVIACRNHIYRDSIYPLQKTCYAKTKKTIPEDIINQSILSTLIGYKAATWKPHRISDHNHLVTFKLPTTPPDRRSALLRNVRSGTKILAKISVVLAAAYLVTHWSHNEQPISQAVKGLINLVREHRYRTAYMLALHEQPHQLSRQEKQSLIELILNEEKDTTHDTKEYLFKLHDLVEAL